MFKRIISVVIIILLCTVNAYGIDKDDISAECAVVMVRDTGEVVFEKNASQKHSMASTTKIMTALLAVESGMLRNEFTVDTDSIMVEGTSMGLQEGDEVSLLDLTYGMLLPSGNDAANATAVYLGGSIENFVKLMNGKATEIGMKNTNFVTPSGLDDDNHYSTAYDMALLGCYAVKNRQFVDVCSKQKVKLNFGNPPYDRWLYNHNKLLSYYDYALGIKTGFTKKSGRCLVSYAEKDGVGLVAVTLNAPNDWSDHIKMLDYGFEQVTKAKLNVNIPKQIDVVGGTADKAEINPISLDINYLKNNGYTYKVFIDKFVYAPVTAGDIVGRVDIFYNDSIINSISITIKDDNNGR